ncbi:alpha/beta fold hydrolase [Burkholderia ubonensis]|uniref:alpha/beta fold hydrolase n=1 Tax=Burkholderia ubonensis TaxID=101571 RepID=UPI001C52FFCA|nr:alpha/beta fold hydrolase [Burkholderia ubonensis]
MNMKTSSESIVVRDGVRIAASVSRAPADLPRIALLHSLAMDRAFWAPMFERLAAEASVLAIDARGHGASDKPVGPYTTEQMAGDLKDVIDWLDWPDVVVAGASMGGCVALQFAGTHSARTSALGLIDTTAWYGPEAKKNWSARAERAAAEGLAAMVDFQTTRWFSDAFRAARPEVVEACVQTFLRNDVQAFGATCEMLGGFDGRALMENLRMPTAVIVGEEDYAAPLPMAQALHDGIDRSTLTVIPAARHLTPLETPDVIASELRELLIAGAGIREGRRGA